MKHFEFTPAQRRAIDAAIEFADRYSYPDSGMVGAETRDGLNVRESVYAAITFLLTDDASRHERAERILQSLMPLEEKFSICALLLVDHVAPGLLSPAVRQGLSDSIEAFAELSREDIIAGRNINLPLQTWTVRLASGIMHNRPQLVDQAVTALEQLTDLVAAHGSTPEFNSNTYEPITLQMLRVICLLGEPRTSALASALERHLWRAFALRWHPRLRVHCGPWARAYQDNMTGGCGNAQTLGDLMWGALRADEIGYQYDHAHDFNYGGVLSLLAENHPVNVSRIALDKSFPFEVRSNAEQVDFRLGEFVVPGGIAELTTWMDENLAVGTASRSHVHAMQNGTYIAQWSRTGRPVDTIDDLGQAYTRFAQNGRRPGTPQYYRNHHHGRSFAINSCLWADDGRPFALQSGSIALVLYVPKAQERRHVQRLEMFVVLPSRSTPDEVYVNGERVEEYEGDASAPVVIRSGNAALGMRFAACAPIVSAPALIVERSHGSIFVGLRMVAFDVERELPESEYRRYAGSIGLELRYVPTDGALRQIIDDTRAAMISDVWNCGETLAGLGGPREVSFDIGEKQLYGRFAPIAETWLRRRLPAPDWAVERIAFNSD